MDQLMNVKLTIEKVHKTPQRALDYAPWLGGLVYMWHFQVEYVSRGKKLLHWFKLCIHDLIRTRFQLESVTYIKHQAVYIMLKVNIFNEKEWYLV